MVNVILYKSSVICSILHYIGYIVFKPNNQLLLLMTTLGLFTSLWNHAVTCNIAKYADRITMCLCLLLNLYIIHTVYNIYVQLTCINLLIISICLYLYSKINNVVRAHLLSHLFLTINHLVLMEYFSNSRKLIVIYINVP